MIKNYLVITLRNLFKNRVFALINILGLGLALAICIVAYFNHMFAYEFDRNHENFDKIYRVNSFRDMQGRDQEYGLTPATLGLEIKKDIPALFALTVGACAWTPLQDSQMEPLREWWNIMFTVRAKTLLRRSDPNAPISRLALSSSGF